MLREFGMAKWRDLGLLGVKICPSHLKPCGTTGDAAGVNVLHLYSGVWSGRIFGCVGRSSRCHFHSVSAAGLPELPLSAASPL